MTQRDTLKTLIIAEAGVNHNGDISLARQLIDVAADAGADFVLLKMPKKPSTKIRQRMIWNPSTLC